MTEEQNHAPLAGLHVLVTRAVHQSSDFAEQLRNLGAEALEVPLLRICAPEDWSELDAAIKSLSDYSWIIFASSNAVQMFFHRLAALSVSQLPESVSIAAIGPATAHNVRSFGYQVRFQPSKYIAESLVADFPGMPDLQGQKILWVRGNIGRDLIAKVLSSAGARVDATVAYRQELPENAPAVAARLAALLAGPEVDIVSFASGQTARNLAVLLQQRMSSEEQRRLLSSLHAVTIGPETTKAAASVGFVKIEQAAEFDTAGLLGAVQRAAAAIAAEKGAVN